MGAFVYFDVTVEANIIFRENNEPKVLNLFSDWLILNSRKFTYDQKNGVNESPPMQNVK